MISFERKNRIMAVLAILVFLIYWILAFILFPYLPEQFPIHFDLSGNHTRMVDKTWGNWLLTPLILTITAAILVTLMLRFVSIGMEHYNFSFKNEVLKLEPVQKKPFEQALRGFLKFAMWTTALYLFLTGILLRLNVLIYIQQIDTVPIFVLFLALTFVYLAIIFLEYKLIKTTFRKHLDSHYQ